jgi:PAS domain S-box-containing protein
MGKKPTYAELEQRVKKLEKLAVTYSQAKASLIETLEKHPDMDEKPADPAMALDVLDQEIADHKPVEQALIAEHILRKTIEKSVPCGIVAVDLRGRQTYVNPFFCSMVGWHEEDLAGSKFPFVYLSEENIDDFQQYFQKTPKDCVFTESAEFLFLRKNERPFWGLVQFAPLHDSEGQRIGMLMSVVDISMQKQAEEKLRRLSSRLIDAQETERKHISAEIHDSIGGKLTGIKYSLEKAIHDVHHGRAVLEKPLHDTLNIVQDVIEEAQRIIKSLHPSILEDLGILSAIKSYCREFQRIYSGISIRINFIIDENQIPESLKILIYRVMQEALNNIAKHSGAEKAAITLKRRSDRLILEVSDNGQGFEPEAILTSEGSTGLGIVSMSERTELFGGVLDIETGTGKGTLVRASWPFPDS